MLKEIVITISLILLITNISYAQKGKGHGKANHASKHHQGSNIHHKNKIKRSVYRPKTFVVYHPGWAPKKKFNRRWVYFPRHNFYWDNWREVYVYRNANTWITNATPPSIIVNVTIENEKHYELKESDDDSDDVYSTNYIHTEQYKAD